MPLNPSSQLSVSESLYVETMGSSELPQQFIGIVVIMRVVHRSRLLTNLSQLPVANHGCYQCIHQISFKIIASPIGLWLIYNLKSIIVVPL